MTNYFLKPLVFNVMAKPMGSVCNLNCAYCYYLEKKSLFLSSSTVMSDLVLSKFTEQYIAAQQLPIVNFVWQGGEPCLAGLGFYKKALYYQQKYANGKSIHNIIQTNGTLLNDEWCSFFRENNFLVGISIDGTKALHDSYRKTKLGEGSYNSVICGIQLLKKHGVEFNTLVTVNNKNADYPVEIYAKLKELGCKYIQFLPVVERKTVEPLEVALTLVSEEYPHKAHVTNWSVSPGQWGDFLCKVFDEWSGNDIGHYFIQLFDATLANWVGENPGVCLYSENCGNDLVIEANGDVFSCDHYVYPENKLGNILEGTLLQYITSKKQAMFGQKKKSLPEECIQCEFLFTCHGECPKKRFVPAKDGAKLNYLCDGYKKFYQHSSHLMRIMKEELTK